MTKKKTPRRHKCDPELTGYVVKKHGLTFCGFCGAMYVNGKWVVSGEW